MFSPHLYRYATGEFCELSDGVEISRFYNRMNDAVRENRNQNIDSWERFFQQTKLKYDSGSDVTEECSRICDIMLTRDERLRQLIKKNFTPPDYLEIHSRMIGTGMIGGKACGMLLARKITENRNPQSGSGHRRVTLLSPVNLKRKLWRAASPLRLKGSFVC